MKIEVNTIPMKKQEEIFIHHYQIFLLMLFELLDPQWLHIKQRQGFDSSNAAEKTFENH